MVPIEAAAEIWAQHALHDRGLDYDQRFLNGFPKLASYIRHNYPSAIYGYRLTAEILQSCDIFHKTPLERMLDYINASELKVLLDHGASVDVPDEAGFSIRRRYQRDAELYHGETSDRLEKLDLILNAERREGSNCWRQRQFGSKRPGVKSYSIAPL